MTVNVTLTPADLHILRAKLSQNNYPDSWEGRIIQHLDAALAEATRDRTARRQILVDYATRRPVDTAPIWGRSDLPPAA